MKLTNLIGGEKQLAANPKTEIVAFKPDGHWLRYTGKAVFETDPKYAEAALAAMPNLYIFLKPIELNSSCSTLTILQCNGLCKKRVLALLVIITVTIQTDNHIGVMFNDSRFMQICKHRSLFLLGTEVP